MLFSRTVFVGLLCCRAQNIFPKFNWFGLDWIGMEWRALKVVVVVLHRHKMGTHIRTKPLLTVMRVFIYGKRNAHTINIAIYQPKKSHSNGEFVSL